MAWPRGDPEPRTPAIDTTPFCYRLLPSRNIGLQLKAMREKNQLKTQGEKASMRYSLA
jgi:hypothetical protein